MLPSNKHHPIINAAFHGIYIKKYGGIRQTLWINLTDTYTYFMNTYVELNQTDLIDYSSGIHMDLSILISFSAVTYK